MPHRHDSPNYGRAFGVGVALNILYVALEAGFGFSAGSLALLSDASHNLGDVLALVVAWIGHALMRISPSHRRTYGWRGSTILAALINSLLLMAVVGGIALEAVHRLLAPAAVAGSTVMVVAAIGVLINGFTAMLFFHGRKSDLNIRGAFLHMAADAAVSVGVVLGGLTIALTGWTWIDPVLSLVIAGVILVSTWGLLKEAFNLALHAVPADIDTHAVRDYLASLPGVAAVHDLHIWAMSTTETALTAHLVKPAIEDDDLLLQKAQHELHDRFAIEHVTIQIERSATTHSCNPCDPHTV